MSFSRRTLLKVSAASAVLGGIGAPYVARAQSAEFSYKFANNLPESHPLVARAIREFRLTRPDVSFVLEESSSGDLLGGLREERCIDHRPAEREHAPLALRRLQHGPGPLDPFASGTVRRADDANLRRVDARRRGESHRRRVLRLLAEPVEVGEVEVHGETMVDEFSGVSRNDLCPCGSGKKFKKCCLAPAQGPIPAPTPLEG